MARSVRERGDGYLFQAQYRDRHGETKKTACWYWRISIAGVKQKPVSTGCTDKKAAQKWVRAKLAEMERGDLSSLTADTVTLEHLQRMVTDDYVINGRKTKRHIPLCFSRLRRFFGNAKAKEITTSRLKAYAAKRIEGGAAAATVMLDFALLGKGMNLAARDGLLPPRPRGWLPRLRVDNARQGFFERSTLDLILGHLPEDLRGAAVTAYITGWRLASDVLTREWRHVDFDAGWLRLEPGEGKTGVGRMFPLTAELRAVLEAQRAYTDAAELGGGKIIPLVFHRDGKRITTMEFHWDRARKAAGIPKALMHDFRRTAVRNLERAGVPRSDAKQMVGHKTDAMYARYAISDEASLKESAEKLSALLDRQKVEAAKVTAMRRG